MPSLLLLASCELTCRNNLTIDIRLDIAFDSISRGFHRSEFFTTVAANLVKKMPKCNIKYGVDSKLFKDFYNDKGIKPGAFKLKPVSIKDIEKELLGLNARKSTGLDNLPSRFLKDGATFLSKPLAHIINSSITTGSVPNELKIAKVTPLYKKNSRLEVGNYRPISVLPCVSKILEKCVYNQLQK